MITDEQANIYLSLWGDNDPPNSTRDSFRYAVIDMALQICHECGTPEASVKFCAETIADWMKNDLPTKI